LGSRATDDAFKGKAPPFTVRYGGALANCYCTAKSEDIQEHTLFSLYDSINEREGIRYNPMYLEQ